jgi:RHS repeat-associated protein
VDGTVAWSWDPEPFGNTQPSGTFTYNHRFPGQYYDRETGLHHNGFRDYHPTTGRYIESDPVGLAAGLNTYAYVNANPLRFIDPKGTIAPAAAIGACAASIVCSSAVAALAISAEEILRNALQGALQNSSQEENAPTTSPTQPAINPDTNPDNTGNARPGANPVKGEPGSETTCSNKKGNRKQTRRYGSDGYPETDTDWDHDHGVGSPHSHDWGRPADGGSPTNVDRGAGRPSKSGDPGIP